ncbi:LysR family transcriptional regulator [Bosea sp. NBC_00550]|uniref:LysR family transcriptional regulator n=1 Tax=Bosea sp. NBC_00550 TaxID=2969621 RepID=UPI0022303C62|nr:LysR family transcriptional regulator [Bosea sp. NBC_00550]UZF93536.1 LysR family transcriptional regulator [Bosea sp. NBC_00550]
MAEPAPPPSRRDGDLASPGWDVSWDDIRVFNAIAVGGSMAVAAAQLGLSEATVARRLKALERDLGLQLFTREANRLAPTAIGLELAAEAREIEAAAHRFTIRADVARPLANAPVRITATTSISLLLTMHATAISAAAGGVEIVILSTRSRLDLSRGEADIALRMSKVPTEPGYYAQKVGRLMQALYVRRDIDPASAPVISVNRETSSRIDDYIMAYAAGRPIAARVGDSSARYESIRSAGALSMAPCFMGDADPGLVRLEPPPEQTGDDIYLISHDVSRGRPSVIAVLTALRRLFREQRSRLAGDAVEAKPGR